MINCADLTAWSTELMKHLQPHIKTINYIFGIHSNNAKIKDLTACNLKGQIQFINAIIDGAFDLELKLDTNSCDKFYILPSANFVLIGDHDMTVTKKWHK